MAKRKRTSGIPASWFDKAFTPAKLKLARKSLKAGDCREALIHLEVAEASHHVFNKTQAKLATQIRNKCARKPAFKDYKYPSVASLLKKMK